MCKLNTLKFILLQMYIIFKLHMDQITFEQEVGNNIYNTRIYIIIYY